MQTTGIFFHFAKKYFSAIFLFSNKTPARGDNRLSLCWRLVRINLLLIWYNALCHLPPHFLGRNEWKT